MPWEPEQIMDNENVFRHIPLPQFIKNDKGRRFPADSHFELRPNEDGLSANWDKYIDVKKYFILLGLTHNKKQEFLNISLYHIFSYPVGSIRQIEGISTVSHNPIFNGDPAPIGSPNNRSHSVIIYNNNEQAKMNLSDYCRENIDDLLCNFKPDNTLSEEIVALRERMQNTPYHAK